MHFHVNFHCTFSKVLTICIASIPFPNPMLQNLNLILQAFIKEIVESISVTTFGSHSLNWVFLNVSDNNMYSCIPVNAFIVVLETAEINRKISLFTLFLYVQFFNFFSVNFTVADSVEFLRVIPLSSEVELLAIVFG